MYIHTRRRIQKCIRKIGESVDIGSLEELANRLNKDDKSSLASEWEVAVLFALNQLGSISYEPNTGGNQRFDIRFNSRDRQLEFLADVTTVSDDSLTNDNPTGYFFKELSRFLGLGTQIKGHINIELNEAREGRHKSGKINLGLPPKGRIPGWIKQNLANFRAQIVSNPMVPRSFSSIDLPAKIEIIFSPSERSGISANYPSNTTIYSRTNNPITNRLKSKSKQFRNTKFEGTGGIFLCDGGSSTLRNTHSGKKSLSSSQLIENYFRASTQLDFIFVLHPTANWARGIPNDQRFHTNVLLYTRPSINPKTTEKLQKLRESLLLALPEPVRKGYNAATSINSKWRWRGSHIGGFHLSRLTLKIPSRLLMSLLSGDLTSEDYAKLYSRPNSNMTLLNTVQRFISEGRMIISTKLESCPDQDDDWVMLEFGEPDSAISDFRV